MTLLARTSARANRRRQTLAELRVDEQLTITDYRPLFRRWEQVDRDGDNRIETRFQQLYALLDSEAQKQMLGSIYAEWMADERNEEAGLEAIALHNSRQLFQHRRNTPTFVDGQWAPDGEDGAA